MKRPAKLQRSYQILSLRKLDTAKKRDVTLLYSIAEGGFLLAKKAAGESPASLGTDCTVRFACLSELRKRWPYPVGGCPASVVKMLVGMSTLVPVSGTTKRSHRSGCAAAAVDARMMVNAIATRRLGFISFLPQGSIALAELRSAR